MRGCQNTLPVFYDMRTTHYEYYAMQRPSLVLMWKPHFGGPSTTKDTTDICHLVRNTASRELMASSANLSIDLGSDILPNIHAGFRSMTLYSSLG